MGFYGKHNMKEMIALLATMAMVCVSVADTNDEVSIEGGHVNNSNLLLTCDPTFSQVGDILSTGVCKFGDYQIEFFTHLKAATAWLCSGIPYCGVQPTWKGADWLVDTIVKDSNGNIVANNIAGGVDSIELDTSSFKFPYLVLRTLRSGSSGLNNYFHLYAAMPNFHKVISIGPLADRRSKYTKNPVKGFYTNNQQEVFVDIIVSDLPPDGPALANGVKYTIALRLVDDRFEPAVEQMKDDLKIYTQADWLKIYNQALQINGLIIKYVFKPGEATVGQELSLSKIRQHFDIGESRVVYEHLMMHDVYQLGFMVTFVDLAREGRIDLAWKFFDIAIPNSYDLRSEYYQPIYKTKKIMKTTIQKWLRRFEYWDEIKQLNEAFLPEKLLNLDYLANNSVFKVTPNLWFK
jgi:hypothetical protein